MTSQKDFKRLVRARMEETGERYTTARAALRRRTSARRASASPASSPAPARSTPSRPSRDRATTGARPRDPGSEEVPSGRYAAPVGRSVAASFAPEISDAAVKAKTGCDWARWVWALDREQAHEWTHREIARHIAEKYKLNSWWSQTVTVGYERIKGLRAPGQVRGGDFRMSKTRTIAASAARLYRVVRDARSRRRWLPDLTFELRSVTPGKMIRARLSSGVRLRFTFTAKGARKCQVVVEEIGLTDRAAVEGRKEYWGRRLGELGEG